MKSWNKAGKVRLALATALLLTAGATQSWGAAQNTKGEGKCQTTITKSLGKHAVAVAKAMATCKNAVLAAGMGTCPDATAQAAIDKSAAKSAKTVNKKCQSSCSASAVPCIGTPQCPPNGVLTENCTAAGKNFFESVAMGFPGAYCETIINDKMRDPEDFGACSNGVAEIVSDELLDNIYGDLVAAPVAAAQDCLDGIAKALPKSASKLASTVAKCRNTQLTASSAVILPDNCPTADTKVADAITKAHTKLSDAIAKSCNDAAISALSLCGNGIGGTLTVAAAQACLGELLDEASFSTDDAENRPYAGISIINGAYPETSKARCGDNLINQQANQFLLNGEECDGDDLGDCDACLPPGDTFECTCAETRRSRAFANGAGADLDNGWSGSSHNAQVTDRAGFVADITPGSCDCTAMTDATCTGTSVDPVCTVSAELNPRCTNRIGDGTNCDQVGNGNGAHTDSDCQVCGEGASNEGDFCTGNSRYCVGGVNSGSRCNQASDCTGGACSGSGVCVGGVSDGNGCTVNANCAGGTCALFECEGGVDDGEPCSGNADCAGAPTTSRCAQTSDCGSQCIDANGDPQDNCWSQADCPEGTRCSGGCDKSNTCLKIRNGAPLPLSAEGTSVCIDSQFFSNMTGTKNIVTGEHAIDYELRSVTILSNEINSSPCPVCGGWCEITGSQLDQFRCSGSCTGPALECRFGPNIGSACLTDVDCGGALCDQVACRFDDDCTGNGTCDGTASPDCQGGNCRLDLACSLGPNEGLPCRIEASTAFGTTSADCPPDPATNVSGAGLAISWTPLTSGTITAENPAPCDANGYENYDCNCVTGGGGTRNQPNRCAPACNAGPNYGATCDGFTTCVGGAENGAACDEDSDCSGGGLCTGNPRVCGTGNTGACSVKSCVGGSNAGDPCVNDIQCPGGGSCPVDDCTIGGAPCTYGVCVPDNCLVDADCEMGVTCDDVCPTGLCTPLCVPHGLCSGGPRNGQQCALTPDCLGGVCIPDDPEEGACAQGTFEHCDGPGWEFVSCAPLQVGTQQGCEFGTDNIGGNANDNIGAGYCVSDVTQCFINNGAAEGGSTLNGNGDSTNTYSVAAYCIPASSNSAVNATAGLPGPGRIRQDAVAVTNFTSLP